MEQEKLFNIPNLLTLARLILSPLALPILLVYLLPLNMWWVNVSLASLFVLFSLTDFFDGFLARRFHQETILGKVLDPLADKFLTYSTLIALLAAGKIFFYWVVLIIGREFFVMGLRQVALEHTFSIQVSYIGKLKTVFQMLCLTIIILNPYQALRITGAIGWNGIEQLSLFLTLIVSLFSAKQYYHSFIERFKQEKMKTFEHTYQE